VNFVCCFSADLAIALRRVVQIPVSEEHPLHYTPFLRLLERPRRLIGRALIFSYLSMIIAAEIYFFILFPKLNLNHITSP
jgi:hypothetical protein